ncbi:MAG: GNAT family N-acetyltransferase [Phycisphaeraceae bacterium]|nr:GNAT family N-acetyltransferase [Phycisphaeraceae bacterium]
MGGGLETFTDWRAALDRWGTRLPAWNALHHQRPDLMLLNTNPSGPSARCSLWWRPGPAQNDGKPGIIGHFHADDVESGADILDHACRLLTEHGCGQALGPMDGDTWHTYRLIVERGDQPPFFLEPDHPRYFVECFTRARFRPEANYYSSIIQPPTMKNARLSRIEQRLLEQRLVIEPLDMADWPNALEAIWRISMAAFSHAHRFQPIELKVFAILYEPIRSLVDPRLVLLARREGEPVGFVFAIPDHLERSRAGKTRTMVVKSLAVVPERSLAGLGSILLARVYEAGAKLDLERIIHALMHESSRSTNLFTDGNRIIRRYALFRRDLMPGN